MQVEAANEKVANGATDAATKAVASVGKKAKATTAKVSRPFRERNVLLAASKLHSATPHHLLDLEGAVQAKKGAKKAADAAVETAKDPEVGWHDFLDGRRAYFAGGDA